jgi:hypothetical protein
MQIDRGNGVMIINLRPKYLRPILDPIGEQLFGRKIPTTLPFDIGFLRGISVWDE